MFPHLEQPSRVSVQSELTRRYRTPMTVVISRYTFQSLFSLPISRRTSGGGQALRWSKRVSQVGIVG